MNKFPYPFTIRGDMTDAPPNAYALANGSPNNQPHPYHLGDFPPITSCDGYSWMYVYIQQLQLKDVIGRSIVLHGMADDFTTQPSGNSGDKIACGVVTEWKS